MRLTSVNKSGTLSWCPIQDHTDLMAVGSLAGSLDWNESLRSSQQAGTGATLEIYSILPSFTGKQISSLSTKYEESEETPVEEESVQQQQESTDSSDIFQSNDDDFFSNSSSSAFFSSLGSTHQQNELISTEEEEKKKKEAARKHPKLVAQIEAPDRFNRLSWGTPGSTGESLGIVAGAQVDGTISLFDVNKMVESYSKTKKISSTSSALVATLDKHQNSVRGLEFNPKQVNLLASAGEDGQLFIWNLKQPEQPGVVVLGCKNPHQNQTISHLQWNQKFEYILATTSHQGTSVVWDLRQKRVLVPFSNANHPRSRYSSLAWNPDIHTQLLVACEDDERPVIEVWDLRKAYAPIRELGSAQQGHQKGVLSVSWCREDSNLLVSSGKDNRSLIWNPNTGDLLGELSTGFSEVSSSNRNNKGRVNTQEEYPWIFDAQWSYKSTILSTSSFDKKIQVYSVQDPSSVNVESNAFNASVKNISQPTASVLKTAPKWLKRPAGVSWCFGNRLIAFNNTIKQESEENSLEKHQQVQQFMTPNPIRIYSGASALASVSVSESDAPKMFDFNKQVIELEKIVLSQVSPQEKRDLCVQYCKQKQSESQSMEWNLLEILFTSDEEKGKKIQSLLGYNRETIQQQSQTVEPQSSESERNNSEELSTLIKKNIIVGNMQGAINCCLSGNRFSDALVLAKVTGNSELWNYVVEQFLNSKEGSVINAMRDLVYKNYDAVLNHTEESWKEKLATLCLDMTKNKTLIDSVLKSLVEKEEQRLIDRPNEPQSEDDLLGSLLGSFLSGQIEQIFTRWISEFEKSIEGVSTSSPDFAVRLIDLISKIELLHTHHLTYASISKKTTTISYIESILNQMLQNGHVLNQYYITFAMKCIELGSLVDVQKTLPLALRCLNIAIDQTSSQPIILPKDYSNVDIQELRYRLYHSIGKAPQSLKAPSMPSSWIKKKPTQQTTQPTPTTHASSIPPSSSATISSSTRSDSPTNTKKLGGSGYKKVDVQLLPQPLPTVSPISGAIVPPTGAVAKPVAMHQPVTVTQPVHNPVTTTPVYHQPTSTHNPIHNNLGGVASFTPQPIQPSTGFQSNSMSGGMPPMMGGGMPSVGGYGMNSMSGNNNLGGVATFAPQPIQPSTGFQSNQMPMGGMPPMMGGGMPPSTGSSNSSPSMTPTWQQVTMPPTLNPQSEVIQQPMVIQPVVDQQAILRENLEKYAGIDIERNVTSARYQNVVDSLTQSFDKLYGGEDKGAAHLEKKRMIAQSVNALFTLLQETSNDALAHELLMWSDAMLQGDFTSADHTFKSLNKLYFQELKNAKNMRFLMTCLKASKQ
ncbi:predicted protein [Naegleria gruberi]|uniref:Predicted protein n=1 Tax=Naegleria gruberi TaxID=5762 RepID=D2W2P0_NAEGR|nr:uncharacterized protein NAEGRDRAFT_59949 [Naegleria gruberi]EFC36681.1 predicted protein [Naegleria gruberi]|eukprot:XP_002669425.1 predicted protein [Naegleria gruberi strain NEG-M]